MNERMYELGAAPSAIRERFAYGLARKAEIGADKVYDFSLGNPSVPAPDAIAQAIAKALELPPMQLHSYSPAQGAPACRQAIAGNLNKKLHINDIVLGKTMKYLDTDMRLIAQSAPFSEEYNADERLLSAAEKVLDGKGINYISGIIATGDRFIDDKEEAAKIREETGADAVEMEGAAICHAAARNGVPSLVIRAMSDNADTDYEVFKEFDISEFAHTAADIVLDILHNI